MGDAERQAWNADLPPGRQLDLSGALQGPFSFYYFNGTFSSNELKFGRNATDTPSALTTANVLIDNPNGMTLGSCLRWLGQ